MTLRVDQFMVEEVVECGPLWTAETAVANALTTYDSTEARHAASRACLALADEAEKLAEALRR